jgi:hypothetical protein
VVADLPKVCNGCDARFTLQHALGCKKGGLVIFGHNKIRDELVHMAGKAVTPSAVRDKPLIHPYCDVEKLILVQPPKPTQSPPAKMTEEASSCAASGLVEPIAL